MLQSLSNSLRRGSQLAQPPTRQSTPSTRRRYKWKTKRDTGIWDTRLPTVPLCLSPQRPIQRCQQSPRRGKPYWPGAGTYCGGQARWVPPAGLSARPSPHALGLRAVQEEVAARSFACWVPPGIYPKLEEPRGHVTRSPRYFLLNI